MTGDLGEPLVLTVGQVAAKVQVGEKTIYRALADGSLTGSKLGQVWRIRPDAVEAWIDARQVRQGRPRASDLEAVRSRRPRTRAGRRGSLRGLLDETQQA